MNTMLLLLVAAALATQGSAGSRVRRQEQPAVTSGDQQENSCSNGQGVCVSYILCVNGTVATDGEGIIQIKTGPSAEPLPSSDCKNRLHVCCRRPPSPDSVTPYVPSCGTRNHQRTDARLGGFKDGQAQFAEFPWMAAVLKTVAFSNAEHQYICGGSLIDDSLVLTVAHCVTDIHPDNITVRLGAWDIQSNNELYPHQDRKVSSVIIHPDYNKLGDLYNDYAILHLKTPANLTVNVDTVCLGTSYIGDSCFVAGWGKDKFGEQGKYQQMPKKLELSVWDNETCQDTLRTTSLGRYFSLDQSFICAGGEAGKDTCTGDGGSALVCQSPYADIGQGESYILVGMVSWGVGCGESGIPGVYASVPFAYDWIQDQNLLALLLQAGV